MHLREDWMSRKPADTTIPEAVHWFHRFRIKGPTALEPDESAEWALWFADRVHQAAFQQVEQLWEELHHLKNLTPPTCQDLDADGYDPEQSLSEFLAGGGHEKARR